MSLRAAVLLVALLASPVAHATVLRRMDLTELARTAESVVLGRVEDQQASWDPSGRRIVTRVHLRVERALKGTHAEGAMVTFERLGGVVDGVGQKVFGEASFSTGETALLFLRKLDPLPGASMRVVGMAQGKLGVFTGADGVRRIGRNLGGVHLFEQVPGGGKLPALPEALPRTLDEVVAEIQRVLQVPR